MQEKEIPAYAMQPARAPQMIPTTAVYHRSDVTVPLERQRITYQFEEDILVPDTKDDMMEILFLEASCDIAPAEKKLQPKTDDLLNFTGTVTVQTLYHGDQEGCLPIAITSKIPYKYQWNLHCTSPAEGYFCCNVKNVEHMIINERKFRVKITLEILGSIYEKKELPFFQSLEEDSLELKTKEIGLNCLTAILQEDIAIETRCEVMDLKELPTQILWQHYTVTENYRQVTSEKIVLNGFIYVNLLYLGRSEDEAEVISHRTERVEFTQFIPLPKNLRERKWSFVKIDFCNQGLHTVIDKTEDGKEAFRVEGTLRSRISLYEERRKEIVIDAYHLEKEFLCTFETYKQMDLAVVTSGDFPVKSVIQLPEGCAAEAVLVGCCKPVHWNAQLEKNRVILTGNLQMICLWKGDDGYRTTKSHQDFQQSLETEGLDPAMQLDAELFVRDCHLTLLNERQLEMVCNLAFTGDGYREKELTILRDPAFMESGGKESGFMVITAVEEGETLWDLAKRYKTTQTQICSINRLDETFVPGQKLLILR